MAPSTSSDAVIEVVDLHREYRMGDETVSALRGVGFTVRSGEMVAIVGRSGSGKTTLMNLLGCLDRPTRGSYRLGGHDVQGMGDDALSRLRNEHIGFVFQSFHLLPRSSALKNVELPLVYRGIPRGRRRAMATAALQRVGLGHRVHHRPNQMSGGERQRVAIARALVHKPRLVLADEPTGNLDPHRAGQVLGLLRERIRAAGAIGILVTHSLEAAATADRVLRLTGDALLPLEPTR